MRIVFDLDGTLVDSTPTLLATINTVLAEHNLAPSNQDENHRYAGHGLFSMFDSTIRSRVPDWEEKQRTVLVQEMLADYSQRSTIGNVVYEGVPTLLEALQQKGFKLCIISNKLSSLTKAIVANSFPTIRFEHIYGEDSGFAPKPDPGSLNQCRTLLKDQEPLIYVGDTEIDYETARNAKVTVYLATWGYRGKKTLLSYGIAEHLLIAHPMQLVCMIEQHKERTV